MEKVLFVPRNTEIQEIWIALIILGLLPCNINFSYILPYPNALFHPQISLWNECYLPNLEDYFETARCFQMSK